MRLDCPRQKRKQKANSRTFLKIYAVFLIYCGQIDRSKGKVLKNLEIVRDRDIKI